MKRQRARTQGLAPRHLSQRQAARTDNVRTDACLSMGKIDRPTEQSCDACEAGQRRAQPRSSPSQLADQASQRARTRACTHGARGPAATATWQLLSASTVRVCGRRGRCGGVSLLNHDTPLANRNLEPADQRATEADSHPGGSEQQANSSGCDRVAGGDHPTRWLPPSTRWPGCRAVDDRNLIDPDGCWLDHLLLLAMLR